jgi:hypothetical protein
MTAEQEISDDRSQRAAILLEAACDNGYEDDGEGSAHVDVIADICHNWRGKGNSIAELLSRVTSVLITEILNPDDVLASQNIAVRDAIDRLLQLDEAAAN